MVTPVSPLVKRISLEDFEELHPKRWRRQSVLTQFFENIPVNTAAILKHDGLKCAILKGKCVAKGTASHIARERNVWIEMVHLPDGTLAVACKPRKSENDNA